MRLVKLGTTWINMDNVVKIDFGEYKGEFYLTFVGGTEVSVIEESEVQALCLWLTENSSDLVRSLSSRKCLSKSK